MCKDSATFILYDKHDMFKDCGLLNSCGNRITISHDAKYSELSPNNNRSSKDKSIIVLHKIEIKNEDYSLYFWRPYSGAAVNLTYRKNGKEFKLIDYVIGTF